MLDKLFTNLLALLITMLTGAVLAKVKLITPTLRKNLNTLLYYFALPIFVFNSMRGSITLELLQTSYYPMLFGIGLALINGLIAFLATVIWRIDPRERRLFAFLNMFGNNIYLALPIAQALFGAQGVAVVLLYSFGSDLILWSLGQFLLSGETRFSLASIKQTINPTLVALALGSAAGIANLWLPPALEISMDNMASITSPLALLLTGAALAEIKLGAGSGAKQAFALFITKLIISPLIAVGLVSLLPVPGEMRTIIIILASMPTFVRSIVLSDRFGWDGQKTALGVLVTTLGCFITIPIILQLV
ncbi:MAG: AEC family transporter [Firmicutes bacterium]|nr:AEC family transporter [Bacillota bacterium]